MKTPITWNESSLQCKKATDEFQCDDILALPISFPVPFNIKRSKHISIHSSNYDIDYKNISNYYENNSENYYQSDETQNTQK